MRTRSKVVVASYVFACLVFDLFPRFGPPNFRYTGSDSTVPVWNLGWPHALAIYDARSGLHISPSVYFVPPAQLLGLVTAMALVTVLRWVAGIAGLSWRGRPHPGPDA